MNQARLTTYFQDLLTKTECKQLTWEFTIIESGQVGVTKFQCMRDAMLFPKTRMLSNLILAVRKLCGERILKEEMKETLITRIFSLFDPQSKFWLFQAGDPTAPTDIEIERNFIRNSVLAACMIFDHKELLNITKIVKLLEIIKNPVVLEQALELLESQGETSTPKFTTEPYPPTSLDTYAYHFGPYDENIPEFIDFTLVNPQYVEWVKFRSYTHLVATGEGKKLHARLLVDNEEYQKWVTIIREIKPFFDEMNAATLTRFYKQVLNTDWNKHGRRVRL